MDKNSLKKLAIIDLSGEVLQFIMLRKLKHSLFSVLVSIALTSVAIDMLGLMFSAVRSISM